MPSSPARLRPSARPHQGALRPRARRRRAAGAGRAAGSYWARPAGRSATPPGSVLHPIMRPAYARRRAPLPQTVVTGVSAAWLLSQVPTGRSREPRRPAAGTEGVAPAAPRPPAALPRARPAHGRRRRLGRRRPGRRSAALPGAGGAAPSPSHLQASGARCCRQRRRARTRARARRAGRRRRVLPAPPRRWRMSWLPPSLPARARRPSAAARAPRRWTRRRSPFLRLGARRGCLRAPHPALRRAPDLGPWHCRPRGQGRGAQAPPRPPPRRWTRRQSPSLRLGARWGRRRAPRPALRWAPDLRPWHCRPRGQGRGAQAPPRPPPGWPRRRPRCTRPRRSAAAPRQNRRSWWVPCSTPGPRGSCAGPLQARTPIGGAHRVTSAAVDGKVTNAWRVPWRSPGWAKQAHTEQTTAHAQAGVSICHACVCQCPLPAAVMAPGTCGARVSQAAPTMCQA